jgi:hypothetical protein
MALSLQTALTLDQGFFVMPETHDDFAYAFWTYSDDNGNLKVLSLFQKAHQVSKFDSDYSFDKCINEIVERKEVYVEEGAVNIERALLAMGKTVLRMKEDDLIATDFSLMNGKQDDDDADWVPSYLRDLIPILNDTSPIQKFSTSHKLYPEIVLLRCCTKYSLIGSLADCEYSFGYTSASFEKIMEIVNKLN